MTASNNRKQKNVIFETREIKRAEPNFHLVLFPDGMLEKALQKAET